MGVPRAGLRHAVETLRYEGAHILLWRFICRLLSPFGWLGLMTFYERDLTKPVPQVSAKIPITIGTATEVDMDELVPFLVMARGAALDAATRQRIRQNLVEYMRKGDQLFVARVADEVVHTNHIAFEQMEFSPLTGRVRVPLLVGEAYMTNGYTKERWRGRGIHGAVNGCMLRFLQQRGYRRAFTQARTDNLLARRGVERLGWQVTGSVLYFRLRLNRAAVVWSLRGSLWPFNERLPNARVAGPRLVYFPVRAGGSR